MPWLRWRLRGQQQVGSREWGKIGVGKSGELSGQSIASDRLKNLKRSRAGGRGYLNIIENTFNARLNIEFILCDSQRARGQKRKALGRPRGGTRQAKTDEVVREVAIVPVANRRTTIPRIVEPGTAT